MKTFSLKEFKAMKPAQIRKEQPLLISVGGQTTFYLYSVADLYAPRKKGKDFEEHLKTCELCANTKKHA